LRQTFDSQTLGRISLLLVLLLLSGCGLSDYEAKMVEAQEHIRRLDEEAKNLDDPLTIPTQKEKEGEPEQPVANVFFRPPKGIANKPDPQIIGGLIYRYSLRTSAPGEAPAAKSSSDVIFVGLAFANNKPDFIGEVISNFPSATDVTRKQHEVKHPDSPTTLMVDTREYDDTQYSYSINFCQSGSTQVAVVYAITKGKRSAVATPLALSLESLAIGTDADSARRAFARRNQRGPSGKR
jgi:hypothetical protein